MKTISFNTGRKYTAEGQFVVATLHDDGVVTFFDHSRGIDGLFKLGQHCAFNQTEVMHWYDSGNAGGTERSWKDGMLRDGCNARPQVQAPAETPVQEKPAREHKASIGSISEGTLWTRDLIEAFASELSNILGEQAGDSKLLAEAGDWLEADEDEDEGSELVAKLEDALSENAPAYCFFGAHEGDGACFGFWPSMDEINELPRVEGSDEAKALGEDCAFVNDHGNVTVYGGDGSIILELV